MTHDTHEQQDNKDDEMQKIESIDVSGNRPKPGERLAATSLVQPIVPPLDTNTTVANTSLKAAELSIEPLVDDTVPSTQYVRSIDEKQALHKLQPLASSNTNDIPAIEIKDTGNQSIDAYELLHKARSIPSLTSGKFVPYIEILMLQLRDAFKDQSISPKNKVVICNNLGCAYALLGRYTEAQNILKDTQNTLQHVITADASKAVSANVNIVEHLIKIKKRQ